jgi:hypothetical protein
VAGPLFPPPRHARELQNRRNRLRNRSGERRGSDRSDPLWKPAARRQQFRNRMSERRLRELKFAHGMGKLTAKSGLVYMLSQGRENLIDLENIDE